jgi:DNA-directed RNA polymerase specialized sigma24 family protein
MATMIKDVTPFSRSFISGWEGSSEQKASGAEAVETLSFPFINQLYRTALILTGSPRLAQDLLQATCLQVRNGQHRFHNHDDFGEWMFRILFDTFGSNRPQTESRQGDSRNPN